MSQVKARRGLVGAVDAEVSFTDVCRLVGMEVPDHIPSGRSAKVRCPFGFQHRDYGAEAAFRIYPDTNSGFCFAGCGYYGPVGLAAAYWDVSRPEAAQRLRDTFSLRSVMQNVTWEEAIERVEDPDINRSALAVALTEFCARQCVAWEHRQFEPKIADVLAKCLGLLERVDSRDDVWKWLDVSKQVMMTAMEGETGVSG